MNKGKHLLEPEMFAEEFKGSVVKWQDRYFVVRRGKWWQVALISQEAEDDHIHRQGILIGCGIACLLAAVLFGRSSLPLLSAKLIGSTD